MDLPTGTVTFLFTDIEGSTARWEHDPAAMQACLERHETLLREAIGGHGGRVFKTVGDGMYAAFSSAAGAVEAALAAQRALIAEPWGEGAALLVRIALHTGVAHPRDGDYVGPPLNRAARLLAAGHGGQILVSATAYDLVHDGLPAATALLDLGEHRLKDIVQAERIYQLVASDLRREFPPLATLERRLHNLPLPRNPLVGRKDELAAASVLLLEGTTGLLTLTGSPGSGKTRLAVHLASEVAGSFPDGVFFAALAPVRDPAALPGSIATALGVRPDATQDPYEAVVEYLRQKQLLLVLDNFEQLLAGAPTVAGLLESCPKLKVLATSRAALRIRDEKEFPVSPLPLLDPESFAWPAEAGRYPAVELFIQRAHAVRPDFNPDHATAGTVARICKRLDGLPLAIELAASRILLLTPTEILSRLEHRSELLTVGARDLPDRQRTLREAIAWSHELLDAASQRLFRRLGVFAGGFTLHMVEEVCGVEAGTERVLDSLETLVENHLVERLHVTGGEETARHGLLETIHEFALEQLAASGETDLLRRRHAEACVRLGEEAETELRTARQGMWLRRLEAEAHNIRAALTWCLEVGQPELGLRLAGAIWMFWSKRGHASEGDRWLADLLAHPGLVSAAIRSKALNGAAGIAYVEGDLAHAEVYLEEAIALRGQLGDERGRVKMLANLGMIATYRGDYRRARRLLEETRALNSSLGETRALANDLLNLANLAVYENDMENAVPLYEDSLEHFRLAGDTGGIASALGDWGAGLLYHGAYERAREPLEKSVELFRSLEDGHGVASSLINLGALALCEGDAILAISLLRESLSRLYEFGERRALAACLDHLAQAATAMGDPERGARLMGGAETLRTGGGFPRAPGEQVLRDKSLALARDLLGEGALNAAWAMGAALPLESLVKEALAVTAPPSP